MIKDASVCGVIPDKQICTGAQENIYTSLRAQTTELLKHLVLFS